MLLKKAGLITDLHADQWRAQRYQQSGCTFLVLKDPSDRAAFQQVRSLLASLPDSIRQNFKLIERVDLDKIGTYPAEVLALAGLKGTSFGSRQTGKLMDILPVVKGNHGFYPDDREIQTGFVAVGPGLQKGLLIGEMNMVDICPWVVRLAGCRLACWMEGYMNRCLRGDLGRNKGVLIKYIAIRASKIARFSSGEFVGIIADSQSQPINLKGPCESYH